jgi:hypothetical protein
MPDPFDGQPLEWYARDLPLLSIRGLCCRLRDSRKKLEHHGKRSFCGKEAKKEIAAVEAEFRRRSLDVPTAGQETARWDK